MAAGRTELEDLARAKPDLAKDLAASWDRWAKEVGARGGKRGAGKGSGGRRKRRKKGAE